MENFPKKRGRPRKIPEPELGSLGARFSALPDVAREMIEGPLRSDRSRANAYYADQAGAVVEGLSEHAKELRMTQDPVLAAKLRLGMDWILARKTVLTELGRMVDGQPEEPSQQDVERFQAIVRHIASKHDKLTAKAACAYIRGRRMGERASLSSRRDRVGSLHHDLNAAINVHRQRYPQSTWTEIKRALDMTAGQIERKL
jgi:hypothetical protein